jgi:DNA polymerase I-like protein with 3'-5' exonuclease and polymerase domains
MCYIKNWDYDSYVDLLNNPKDPEYQIIKNLRVGIKNFNFGEVYGAGVKRLQNELVKHGIYWSYNQCKEIYDERKKLFPNIGVWKKAIFNFVLRHKYVRMPFGQIRRLPLASWEGEGFEYMLKAPNFIIQSTASGWFPIIGMILLDRYFDTHNIDAHILLNVHDSILVEIKKYSDKKLAEIKKVFERIMTQDILQYVKEIFNFELTVPLEFKADYMERWR